jgi:hypothetical protein
MHIFNKLISNLLFRFPAFLILTTWPKMEQSFEIYETFRSLIGESEDELPKTISYFVDRLNLENSYAKEMDKLTRKYPKLA